MNREDEDYFLERDSGNLIDMSWELAVIVKDKGESDEQMHKK